MFALDARSVALTGGTTALEAGIFAHADQTTSPRKTIAMAQLLYHRFHLFFPLKDFIYTVIVSYADRLVF